MNEYIFQQISKEYYDKYYKQAGTELCQAKSKLIQIFWVKKIFGSKIFSGQKILPVKKFFGSKNLSGEKNCWVKKYFGPKTFSNFIGSKKNFGSKFESKLWSRCSPDVI